MRIPRLLFAVLTVAVLTAGCSSNVKYIKGSSVVDTPENEQILRTIEAYRIAMEKADASKLLMLASSRYWDDGGTPTGEDDYGYSELKDVLARRLPRASEIRYSLRYKRVRRSGDRAFVDVLIDASYTIEDADGQPVRRDMRDRNQFVLVREADGWKFISGM